MRQSGVKGFLTLTWASIMRPLLGSALVTAAGLTVAVDFVVAQAPPQQCQPPQRGEYLVLVVSETRERQEQLQRTLPANTKTSVCRYLNNIVTRISGLRTVEDANGWARFVNEIVGLEASVARPAEPPPTPAAQAYNPQALGAGYAVLVDYSNRPEVAIQVRQLLGANVGLASYGQRPYLLASYTTNQTEANSILQRLSDRNFLVMIVDSRKVTLIRPAVNF